jgi:hypothetical protein
MKNFERGNILAQRDYTKSSRREEFGLLFVLCFGAILFFVLKLAAVI